METELDPALTSEPSGKTVLTTRACELVTVLTRMYDNRGLRQNPLNVGT